MANMIPISTITVGSGGAATIDFIGIPQIYTDLTISLTSRNASGTSGDMGLRFNGSSAANYSRRTLVGTGSGAVSGNSSGDTLLTRSGVTTGTDNTSNTFASTQIYIPNYTGSTNKSASIDSVTENNATEAYAQFVAALWSQTVPISSITLYVNSANTAHNFAQYSTATLYGIRKY